MIPIASCLARWIAWLAAPLGLCCLMAACAAPQQRLAAPAPPAGAAAGRHGAAAEAGEGKPALAAGQIIKMPEGKVVSFEEMMQDLRHVRIVYMGENHDNMAHHEGELKVIEGLQARVPSVAVGMEMFQRPYQKVLDAWVAGDLTEKQLLNDTSWYDRWSMDFAYYQPILKEARKEGKKLLALNAPDSLVRAVAAKGIGGLKPEEAAMLPDMDLCQPEHRHFIEHLYQGQGGAGVHHQSNFDHFYEAQCVWDETMAQTVADYLKQPGAAQVLAVIAGNGHIEYGLGVPDDVRRRTGAPSRTISFQQADQVTWGPGPGPPTAMFDYGRPLADYVWLTTAAKEQQRPKMGVIIGKQPAGEEGVRVAEVLKGSPAAKAGLEAGDVILALDGEKVNSLADLRYELSSRQMGEKLVVEARRGGKKANYELTLSPLPETGP